MEEEKEFVYLPKSLAEKVKDLNEGRIKEEIILDYIKRSKDYIKSDVESLDEEVTMYAGSLIKAKNAFKKAKEEQLGEMYEMWEGFDKEFAGIKTKINSVVDLLKPLKEGFNDIKTQMDSVNKWDIESFLKIIKDISSYLNYDNETGKVLRFMFKNYKKKV